MTTSSLKPLWAASFLLSACLLAGTPLAADPIAAPATATTREELQVMRTWEAWRDARVRGDQDAMRALMVEEFTSVRADGALLSRDEYIALWDPRKRSIASIEMSEMRVRLYEGISVVTLKAVIRGKNATTGADLGLTPIRVTSVLRKVDGQWKAVALHVSAIQGG